MLAGAGGALFNVQWVQRLNLVPAGAFTVILLCNISIRLQEVVHAIVSGR
jgi:hypothetical protein